MRRRVEHHAGGWTLTNKGGEQNQEAVLLLPVHEGVAGGSLQYGGVGPEPRAVLERDEERRIYDAIVNKVRDTALVEFDGVNLIRRASSRHPKK